MTQLDRARQVACGLLDELRDVAPERAERLSGALRAAGELWLLPRPAGSEDLVSVTDAAAALGVTRSTLWQWCSRPAVPVNRYPGGVLLSECRAYLATRDQQRAPSQ